MTGLECGHLYCTSCWTEYLSTKIMDEGKFFKKYYRKLSYFSWNISLQEPVKWSNVLVQRAISGVMYNLQDHDLHQSSLSNCRPKSSLRIRSKAATSSNFDDNIAKRISGICGCNSVKFCFDITLLVILVAICFEIDELHF